LNANPNDVAAQNQAASELSKVSLPIVQHLATLKAQDPS
jgi:hypothetical protein